MDPLTVSESEVRFLEVNQNDLEADHSDLLNVVQAEADDEKQLNAAIASLADQLQKLGSDLDGLSGEDLGRVQNEVNL